MQTVLAVDTHAESTLGSLRDEQTMRQFTRLQVSAALCWGQSGAIRAPLHPSRTTFTVPQDPISSLARGFSGPAATWWARWGRIALPAPGSDCHLELRYPMPRSAMRPGSPQRWASDVFETKPRRNNQLTGGLAPQRSAKPGASR